MIRLFPLLLSLACAAPVFAGEPLTPGSRLAPLVLADQHGAEVRIGNETRILLFARDMAGGDVVEEALGDDGAAVLAGAAAVFVSDISRMPGLITRIFALPAMRKRPYRMALDQEGQATAALPHQEDQVTVVRLVDLKVESVAFVAEAAGLRSLLLAAAAPPAPAGE